MIFCGDEEENNDDEDNNEYDQNTRHKEDGKQIHLAVSYLLDM